MYTSRNLVHFSSNHNSIQPNIKHLFMATNNYKNKGSYVHKDQMADNHSVRLLMPLSNEMQEQNHDFMFSTTDATAPVGGAAVCVGV